MERGEGASQPAGEKASPTAAVCASVVLSSIPPCSSSPISHLTLPFPRLVSSHRVSSRLDFVLASHRVIPCHVHLPTVFTARTAQAVLQSPNTMAGRQARFFRSGPCVIEASNSSIHPIHYTTRGPDPVRWRGPSRTTHGTRFINLPASPTTALRLRAHQPPLPCSPAAAVNPLIDPHGHRHRPQQPHQAPQLAGPKQQ